MSEFFNIMRKRAAKFFSRFRFQKEAETRGPCPAPPDLKDMIANTAEEEIDCEGAFALMDRYAELIERGEDASAVLPHVHRHIEMCKDCREELETLLRAIQAKKS